MRYDKKVYFKIGAADPEYDPDEGRTKMTPASQRALFCHVSDLSAEKTLELFGRIDRKALLVHHLGPVQSITEATYNGKDYKIVQARQMRNKASYILTEVVP